MRKIGKQLQCEPVAGKQQVVVTVRTVVFLSLFLIAAAIALAGSGSAPGAFLMLLAGFGWIGLLVSGALWISGRKVCVDCNHVWHLTAPEDLPKLCPDCFEKARDNYEKKLNHFI